MQSTSSVYSHHQAENTKTTTNDYARRPYRGHNGLGVPTPLDLLSAFFVEAKVSTEIKNESSQD
jgi:hypothetical protein